MVTLRARGEKAAGESGAHVGRAQGQSRRARAPHAGGALLLVVVVPLRQPERGLEQERDKAQQLDVEVDAAQQQGQAHQRQGKGDDHLDVVGKVRPLPEAVAFQPPWGRREGRRGQGL